MTGIAIGQTQLAQQLRTLGVRPGGVLLAHISFRAVRPVESGPRGVIEALKAAVGDGGTIVMPSWGSDDDAPFDPARSPVDASLGTTAEIFWRLPQVLRSAHSFAFAALGPEALAVTADPLPLPPHGPLSPVARVHELGGQILLLGVGHDVNTTIHLAEILARVPYGVPRHCTVATDGRAVRIDYRENDHCGERFALVESWLRSRDLQWEGPVGHARALLVDSRDVVAVAGEHLRQDALVFLHPRRAGCAECDAARDSVGREGS